jgi:hypothetical protein
MTTMRLTARFVAAIAVVSLLAISAGGLFGALAMMLYGDGELSAFHNAPAPFFLGPTLGSTGGLLTALAWISLMWRWSPRWIEARRLLSCVGTGAGLGIASGLFASLLLHGGLQLSVGRFYAEGTIIGLVFGLFAGFLVGLVGSLSWAGGIADMRRRREPPATCD